MGPHQSASGYRMTQRRKGRQDRHAKTRTLYMVAHDFSGPITVLNGYLSLVQDGTLELEQLAPYLPVMAKQLEHMQRLLQVLLDTARLDEGRLELHLEPLDLGGFVESMIAQLRPVESRHTVTLDRRDQNLPILADPGRLDSIVRNIMSNAIKYSPEGTSIRCVARPSGSYAVLEVTDEGPGIGAADLRRLFTRFGAMTEAAAGRAGVGLGLFLSRQLAKLHGGDLTATSIPHGGSTFRLRLPLQKRNGGAA
jgi:two-component system, OmpR family, sensor histidine kinase VicK